MECAASGTLIDQNPDTKPIPAKKKKSHRNGFGVEWPTLMTISRDHLKKSPMCFSPLENWFLFLTGPTTQLECLRRERRKLIAFLRKFGGHDCII
ncbi:hypothetical protein CEXT_215301 [Caerostris extrusa]|uniref:Uncharacterized protein n=1 Tax=Caerostris extrusa TaxID=172846 RepID=A0AAV4WJV1_CAEEX|nr:hypothetical protein CEXT_215301 [Caerostris extrusa]